jgi:hypothetical protein
MRTNIGKAIFIWLFFQMPILHCQANTPFVSQTSPTPNILFLTIGKGGTTLLKKAIENIIQKQAALVPFDRYDEFASNPAYYFQQVRRQALGIHCFPCLNPLIDTPLTDFIAIVLIRDLRDVVISATHWMHMIIQNNKVMGRDWIYDFVQLPMEDQITHMIKGINNHSPYSMAQNALLWMKHPSVLVVRFEDLVGPQGGGDLKKQKSTLRALAKHIKYDLSDKQIDQIANSLFGGTGTFRKGQIGSWKESFTPYHKELFKEKMGKELIELGYENDYNW